LFLAPVLAKTGVLRTTSGQPLDYMPAATPRSPIAGDRLLSRVAWRLIPFLFLLYVVNYLDRANISFTKKPMQADLKLSETAYGLAAGIFFLGYAALEVPSNLALRRVGARRWIARIVFSWGLVAAAMALVRGKTSFALLRALLGAAEAGFMPGIILYLSNWFPARQRGKAFGLFLTSTALSGVIGSPLSAQLLKFDGLAGLHGWQWIFLIEGIACMPLAWLTLRCLPDHPADARWLSPEETAWLDDQLTAEGSAHAAHDRRDFLAALRDGRVWLLSVLYFLLISGLFGFIFWAPSAITDHTGGWLTAIPYCIGAVTMVLIGRHSDKTGERRWHVAGCALLGAAGMAATALCPNTPLALVTLSVGAVGIWGCLGPFWAIPTSFLRGDAAAAGIAVINSIGCTAGFFIPSVIGRIKDHTGGYEGLYLVAAALLAAAFVVQAVAREPVREREHLSR
jgi:ACS family tartrate transporter-like MFS transporter